jgi:hypothetical protein
MSDKKKTVAELIKHLETKDQASEVEFIVVKTSGEIVCMDVQSQAVPMIKALKMFG